MDANKNQFLSGGGEAGGLIRGINWKATPLGDPAQWPVPLKIAVTGLLNSSVPMQLLWGPGYIQLYNDALIPVLGKTRHPGTMGRSFRDTAQNWAFVEPLLLKVKAGEHVRMDGLKMQLNRSGFLEDCYVDLFYSPVFDENLGVCGIQAVIIESTERFNAIALSEENKKKLDFAIDAAELGTFDLDPATYKFHGNNRLKAWFGLPAGSEIDLQLATDVIAEKDRKAVTDAITKALEVSSGGHYGIEYAIIHPTSGKETIVRAKGRALFTSAGIPYHFSGTVEDVTEEFRAKKQLEENESFIRNVIHTSPVAKLVLIGEEMTISVANEAMLQILGRDWSIQGKSFFNVISEFADSPLRERLKHVLHTGEVYYQPEEKVELVRFGIPYTGYYNYIYKPLRHVAGDIYGIIITATEVTDQVWARQTIEAKEKELRDLIIAAPIGICVVSGRAARIEEVNDRFILISGKPASRFVNATYWEVFPEVEEAFAPILANVFDTGIKFTITETELTLVRGGIPDKMYATFDYVPIVDTNKRVTKIIVLVIEVTHQVEIRKKIEEGVEQRTRELADLNLTLKRSNSELEQFAYIASHDLQEPIRKISIFTQMLEQSLTDISDKSGKYLSKISDSTERMSKLIRDVLAFSQLSQNTDAFESVDLENIIKDLEADFELLIEQTGANIEFTGLPTIFAIPSQMIQLFGNLLSNSIKYRRKDIAPLIKIASTIATGAEISKHPQLDPLKEYHHIQFSDNGIGFDETQADRIFKIFQRLHPANEFGGTGIGLSICRKIVQSHHGHISATASVHGGAVFTILLPK